jgi:hypothetical protein
MSTMLSAMRERGWEFDAAWASAIQRMRVVPDMDPEEAAELIAWKFWLNWAKPRFRWAFDGAEGEPPALPDVSLSESAANGNGHARIAGYGSARATERIP